MKCVVCQKQLKRFEWPRDKGDPSVCTECARAHQQRPPDPGYITKGAA